MKHFYVSIVLLLMCLLRAGAFPDDQKNLFNAVRSGNIAEVKRCLAAGAKINSREIVRTKPRLDDPSAKTETQGDTPLMIASYDGRLEVVKLLLAHGADVNLTGEAGYTPLMHAMRHRHADVAVLLLKNGAKPDQRNENGQTAICFAANENDAALVTLLLDLGADINGGTSWTPLMDAAYNGQIDMVKLLLKRGANVNPQRDIYMTPLECALVQGNDDVATLLRNAGGKVRSAAVLEQQAAKSRKAAQAEAIRRQADDLRFRNQRVITPEDQDVVEAALQDMIAYKGKDWFQYDPAQYDIALADTTASGLGLIMDNQLNGELDVAQANDVTREMREQLQQRNGVSTSLKDFKPRDPHILMIENKTDGKASGSLSVNFTAKYPHSRGWIQFCLPAYSKQHEAVVLRFSMGPSAHGMAGTYFLIKQNGKWHVKWRCFAHYV